MERQTIVAAGDDAPVRTALHALRGQPFRHRGRKTESDDDDVRFQQRFAALDRHGAAAPARIGFAELGLHHLHSDHLFVAIAFDQQRLAVEQETHAFLARVGHFSRGTGHVGLVAAVSAGDLGRAQTDGAAHAVHAGVAAAQHHHALAAHVGQLQGVFPAGDRPAPGIVAADDASGLHQERQCGQHAFQVLSGQSAIGIAVGAGAEEYGVVVAQQFLDLDIAADLHAQMELHAHAFQHLAAARDDALLQLEAGNAELHQSTDLFVTVEHHRLDAVARQHIGARESRGPRADHGDALAGSDHFAQIRAPAFFQRRIDDVFLHRADGDRAEAVFQRATAFAKTILRADAAAHLGQRIGGVAERRGFFQAIFLHQLQPLRNGVVHRAFPAAIRIAAIQAAPGLVLRLGQGELAVHLAPVAGRAQFQRDALRHLPGEFDELEDLFAAHGVFDTTKDCR